MTLRMAGSWQVREPDSVASPPWTSQARPMGWFALLTNGLAQIDSLPENIRTEGDVFPFV